MKNNFAFLFLIISWIGASAQTEPRPPLNCSLTKSQIESAASKSAFCNDCDYWQNGIVPYEFDSNVQGWQQTAMLNAMAIWESVANIDFVPHNGESDYLRIKDANVNNSHIGRQGGGQVINIYNWNYPMIMCHELAHALGFYHEQSRPDRDNYVQIQENNICPGLGQNFDIDDTGVTSNIPYDFKSIIHYDEFAFSRCQNASEDCDDGCLSGYIGPTIELLPPFNNGQYNIGQRNELSRSDSILMSLVYPYPHYRIVNGSYQGTFAAGVTLYAPWLNFEVAMTLNPTFPENAIVWAMPGDYSTAEGTYTQPMTVRAPYGGVVLR